MDTACRDHSHEESWQSGLESGLEWLIDLLPFRIDDAVWRAFFDKMSYQSGWGGHCYCWLEVMCHHVRRSSRRPLRLLLSCKWWNIVANETVGWCLMSSSRTGHTKYHWGTGVQVDIGLLSWHSSLCVPSAIYKSKSNYHGRAVVV